MDDDDDKFVARRGSQGDEWHWEESPLDHTADRVSSPSKGSAVSRFASKSSDALRSSSAAVMAAAGSAGRPLRPVLRFLGRVFEPAKPAPPKPPRAPKPPKPPGQASLKMPQISFPKWSRPSRISRPQLMLPRRRWTAPRIARPKLSRPGVWSLPSNAREPIALFAGLALATAIAVAIVIAVVALDDDDGASVVVPGGTHTPKPTRSVSPTDGPTRTADPGQSDTPSPSPSQSPTPSPTVSPTPLPTPAVTPSAPQGQPALALWANKESAWRFGNLTGDAAQYEEGQYVPIMIRWDAAAGQTFRLQLTYDCAAGGALGAFDYLAGVEQWGRAPIFAEFGPAKDLPDAAVPVPDTANLAADDNEHGVFTLYGGTFSTLPASPAPSGNCNGARTIDFRVTANGGTVTLMGSAHLALASVWGSGSGASSSSTGLGVRVTLEGVGAAGLAVDPSAIADVQH